MRQYEPIWMTLKKEGVVSLFIHRDTPVRRVIQAIRKEKWRDDGFRLAESLKGKQWKLVEHFNPTSRKLTVHLVPHTGLSIYAL